VQAGAGPAEVAAGEGPEKVEEDRTEIKEVSELLQLHLYQLRWRQLLPGSL
jgi:hypothetical protein